MPKKIEKFECDICKRIHETENDAIACEGEHLKIEAFEKLFYGLDDRNNQKKYPSVITVKFSDGSVKYYEIKDTHLV